MNPELSSIVSVMVWHLQRWDERHVVVKRIKVPKKIYNLFLMNHILQGHSRPEPGWELYFYGIPLVAKD